MFAQGVIVRRVGVGLALLTTLLTAGCAAGQIAHTAYEKPTLDGTNAEVGQLKLRGIVIEAPSGAAASYTRGSAALLKLVIVNSSNSDDTLTSISSPAFSDWGAFASPTDASAVASAATAAVATSAPAALPTPQKSVVVAGGSQVSWGMPSSKGALLLTGVSKQLYPASTVPITFTFDHAGSVKVAVPVSLSTSPPQATIPVPSTSSIEG